MLEGDAREDPAERIAEARAAQARAPAQTHAQAAAMPGEQPTAPAMHGERPATAIGDARSRRHRVQARCHGGLPVRARRGSIVRRPSNRDASRRNALISHEALA
jgi:hypothetical protein